MRKTLIVVAAVAAVVAGGVAAAQALRGEEIDVREDITTKQATPSESAWDSDRMREASPAPMPGE